MKRGQRGSGGRFTRDEQGVATLGSERHVTKTHGTHNGRTGSWPHLSDAIDRPAHLRDLTVERASKPIPSRHRRLGTRQLRSTLGKDSLRAHAVLGAPRWDVAVEVNDLIEKRHVIVNVSVTARDAEEAERLALDLAEYMRVCLAVEATAKRR